MQIFQGQLDKNMEQMKGAYDRIEEMRELVQGDYYRLKYHIMPPAGLLNDPNGFIHIYGYYHLFYQFHPFDTKHGLKYWGHIRSKDLVHWEDLPIALAPVEEYETHGCYSGSAVNNQGIFTLIYTGNVKDRQGNRETYQCIATSKDGIQFEKCKRNPVMRNQPQGYTRHFRDPKVWRKDGSWYMVIGAQTMQGEGRVLLFQSDHLKNWTLIGEVAGSGIGGLGYFGYMWECPDMFELGGKDVLIACPQGLQPQGDLYNNKYQCGYFIGTLDYKTGRMEHHGFTELDRGFEFYAAQTTLDEKGRRILIAWMGLPEEEEHPTIEYGWIHAMTLPRVLVREGNKICQKPVEELKALRKNPVVYRNIMVEDEEIILSNIHGDVLELLVEFEVKDAKEFGIKLRCSEDGKERTIISYSLETKKVEFNRNHSGRGYKGIRRCSVKDREIIQFHIFMDTSSVEIFLNDGEEVFTGRIYPNKSSRGIRFYAVGGKAKIRKLEKWDL